MTEIASLWVGKPLTKIENTCLSSFIANGHSVTLYVYDKDMVVPRGVKKQNANDIINHSELFIVDNSYGPFADLFRYKMIQQTGMTWTDTDNICLRDDWDFGEYLFGEQGGGHGLCANGILKSPANSHFINDLVSSAEAFDRSKITWGEIGPQMMTSTLKKYNLEKFIQPPETFFPIHYWEWKQLWSAQDLNSVLERTKNSHTIQIWNQMGNRNNIDKNNLPSGSIVDYYYRRFCK